MGWGARRNGGGGNGHAAGLLTPSGDRRVHITDVTKLQLAQALNEQSERFKQTRENLQKTTALLIAIVREPESLQHGAEGKVSIHADAVERVKNGMTLHINNDPAGDFVLSVVDEAPQIEVPRIVVPS